FCHPVDNPVHNMWITSQSCGYPAVTHHGHLSPRTKLSTGTNRSTKVASRPGGPTRGGQWRVRHHGGHAQTDDRPVPPEPFFRPVPSCLLKPEQIRTEGTEPMAGHLG